MVLMLHSEGISIGSKCKYYCGVGVWINNGAWSGCESEPYFNIGIEPAMLPVDDLSKADNPPVLHPGQVVEWFLNVSLF